MLAAARLSPLYVAHLQSHFTLHDRLHTEDLAAFEKAAPHIRAVAGSGESRVSRELISQLPALEIISVFGVGYDGVDVAAARERGVMVTHTPNVLNDDVADLAIGLMLSAARQLPAADRYVREGLWLQGPMPLARKMSGARLGLVGMGRIGQAIAHRALAFGMSVAYHARSARPALPYRFEAKLTDLAQASDFLVVITPGGAGTRHLVNAEVLQALGPKGILVNVARGSVVDEAALVQALGPKGILVNVARGSVVDEAALIEALEGGVIGGAALDVFEDEPRVPQRLIDLPQVVLVPHIGSATGQTRQAMADLAFGNVREHFAGRPVLTPVPECAPA